MSDPTSRTLDLLSLLQTHRHWKGEDLARRLGVSERTVRRDVDRLRVLGYPVDAIPGVDGGYRLAAGSNVPPLLMNDDEAVALIIGLRAAAVASIEGIEETSVALLAKVDQMLPARLREKVRALHSNVEVLSWSPPRDLVGPATLTLLSRACRDREEVRFGYRRGDGETSRRLVQPHQLVSAGRRWYLVAWDTRRFDWRTFRVDRLSGPTLGGVRFESKPFPSQDAATFVAEGMSTMAVKYEAQLVVQASIHDVEPVARRIGGAPKSVGDGQVELVLSADSTEWLASKVAFVASRFVLASIESSDDVREVLEAFSTRTSAALDAAPRQDC